MKTNALKKLRAKLSSDQPVFGLWITLESASITEMAVALGLDWIVVDAEHGHLDWSQVLEHIRAAVRSETVVLVRIAERSTALAKRALDIGADGIVVPMVETVEQLQEALSDCWYPPEGRRGIGGERATVWGQCLLEHTAEANQNVLVVPIIESVRTLSAIPAMTQHSGIDVFFFGPADFSATAGHRGHWEGPGVAEQLLRSKDILRGAGKACGLLTRDAQDLVLRRSQGFQMLGLGTDAGMLLRSTHEMLRSAGCDRTPSTSLDPNDGAPVCETLQNPPERMRPDRLEIITNRGMGREYELQRGVSFEALVGTFNTARNVTTGIVTFQPEAVLDAHSHPCSESITVLVGEAEVTVEGRIYQLGPLDNIVIPRWVPHSARNLSASAEVRLHVALATSVPERAPISQEFARMPMPDGSTGLPGMERVTRLKSAKRSFGVGTGTEFIDYFNADLVPGIEMSGGYGRFQPGGRLPAHVHDFDESICIINGNADCIVEGRPYTLSDCATAMVPRGRVHYFANESSTSMEMIWVYAGPMPERIVVDAQCATDEGTPWK